MPNNHKTKKKELKKNLVIKENLLIQIDEEILRKENLLIQKDKEIKKLIKLIKKKDEEIQLLTIENEKQKNDNKKIIKNK